MIRLLQQLSLAFPILLLIGCGSHSQNNSLSCTSEPDFRIQTNGVGPEDVVAVALGQDHVRLFAREVCRGVVGCSEQDQYDRSRISKVDLEASTTTTKSEFAWRPKNAEEFEPLGMSFVPGIQAGSGDLFVIDKSSEPKIWHLPIKNNEITADENTEPWFIDQKGVLGSANDLQAIAGPEKGQFTVYVTQFDGVGFLPWRSTGWHGIAELKNRKLTSRREDGFRGANGIVDPGEGHGLVVADYWNRCLRYVSKELQTESEQACFTDELPIYPDNLTLDVDRGRILVAGQRYAFLAGINIILPFVPSPSAVLEVSIDDLGEESPEVIWRGGWLDGRSISVAAPTPNGLALGQIRAGDILHAQCREQ